MSSQSCSMRFPSVRTVRSCTLQLLKAAQGAVGCNSRAALLKFKRRAVQIADTERKQEYAFAVSGEVLCYGAVGIRRHDEHNPGMPDAIPCGLDAARIEPLTNGSAVAEQAPIIRDGCIEIAHQDIDVMYIRQHRLGASAAGYRGRIRIVDPNGTVTDHQLRAQNSTKSMRCQTSDGHGYQ